MFHVYVDPIYGDDARATAQKPTATGARKPLQQHTNPAKIPGYLQHAPYSFHTVTSALQYINQFQPQASNWPWTNPTTLLGIRAIVIHCLPGLYGPVLGTPIDPKSGLPWNGESFPLVIPDHVSIQGTSALDTIFDGRANDGGRNTTIFSLTASPVNLNSHVKSFIDSVTIQGAINTGGQTPPVGAGVFINGTAGPLFPTISNCFIVGNTIGIAVSTDVDDGPNTSPIIVNNTIAWNGCGLQTS